MYAQLTRIGRITPDKPPALAQASFVAIGNFDGVHIGHRSLFDRLVQQKADRDGKIVALSFYPHPSVKLGRVDQIPRITSLRQKLRQLAEIGVDQLCLIHFTHEFSQLSTAEFVEQILIRFLNTHLLVIGQDARVGRAGQGTAEILSAQLEQRGRKCEIVNLLKSEDLKISSRRIRGCITAGQVKEAAMLLGRPFALDARIVSGDQRGRTLDFPTANLHLVKQVLPANGVYACQLRLTDRQFAAVTNVGTRPTFDGRGVRVETHVIDPPKEINAILSYGSRCQVEFIDRLREEIRFEGVAELKAQILIDIAQARQVLAAGTRL